MTETVNSQTQINALLTHLWRGGGWAHYTTPDSGRMYTDKTTGEIREAKISQWFPVDKPAPIHAWADRNVYFSVNPSCRIPPANSRGRKTDQIYVASQMGYLAAINCFFSEFDVSAYGDKLIIWEHLETLPLYPSAVIDSGGGIHCYWLLENTVQINDDNRTHLARVQSAWVDLTGGDPAARDLTRKLRLPGTHNRKPKYAPNFPEVKITEFDDRRLFRLVDFEDLTAALRQRATVAQPVPALQSFYSQGDDVRAAAENLERLHDWRRDDYHEWVRVGMSLTPLGETGRQMWDSWSAGSSKYEPGVTDKKWASFKTGGLGLASLAHWAQQDTPKTHYTNGHSAPSQPVDSQPTPTKQKTQPAKQVAPPPPPVDSQPPDDQPAKQKQKSTWTAAELHDAAFPDARFAVPGLIPEGLSFIIARPKIGKSWLALQIAVAVGTGGMVLDQRVDPGRVLYLALEDHPRRMQDRLFTKQRAPRDTNLVIEHRWPPLQGQSLTDLMAYIDAGGFSLVIIDTLQRAVGGVDMVKDTTKLGAVLAPLQEFALDRHIAIIIIHHARKGNGGEGDVIDDALGSTVLSGIGDAYLGIYRRRGQRDATLRVTGRDIEERELAINFDRETWAWQLLGNAEDVVRGEREKEILEVLSTGGAMTHRQIYETTGQDRSNAYRVIQELIVKNKIVNLGGEPAKFNLAESVQRLND